MVRAELSLTVAKYIDVAECLLALMMFHLSSPQFPYFCSVKSLPAPGCVPVREAQSGYLAGAVCEGGHAALSASVSVRQLSRNMSARGTVRAN